MHQKIIGLIFTLSLPSWAQWTIASTNVGWQFKKGASTFCKYAAVSKVDYTQNLSGQSCHGAVDCCQNLCQKYGGTFTACNAGGCNVWPTWASQMNQRLSNLGFTSVGTFSYSYATTANFPSGGLTYVPTWDTDLYATSLSYSHCSQSAYKIKNAGVVYTGQKCKANYPSSMIMLDPYDPGAQTAINNVENCELNNNGNWTANYGQNAAFVLAQEADDVALINQFSYHPDAGLLVASANPVNANTAANNTNFEKMAWRDYALEYYLCTGNGTPAGGFCTANHLGTGSADPANGSYVGATNATNALATMNTAFGQSYTTWNTSDAGGIAGITAGTYASYGTGTGFLDENGTNITAAGIACAGTGGNGPGTTDTWYLAGHPDIKTVSELFIGAFATLYSSEIRTGYNAACLNGTACPPLAFAAYDGPTYIYTAMQNSADLFWLGFGVVQDNLTLAAATARVQAIINATTKPVVVGTYIQALPDSFTTGTCPVSTWGDFCQTTQALRGSTYTTWLNDILPLKNSQGKFAVIGFENWDLWDHKTEGTDYGLFTPNDNAYDGSQASTNTTNTACTTSHLYTAPIACNDGTNNQSLQVASGTSANSGTVYNANYYGQTIDATAKWFDIGTYTLIPEASNFGNALGPVRDTLTAGICDPTVAGTQVSGNAQIQGGAAGVAIR